MNLRSSGSSGIHFWISSTASLNNPYQESGSDDLAIKSLTKFIFSEAE